MKLSLQAWFAIAGAVAGALLAAPAPAQAPAPAAAVPDRPGVVVVDKRTLTATVEAVDRQARTVTLRGREGVTVTLKAPPEAAYFERIKVGDTVQADYYDAIALFVRSSNVPPQAGESSAVRVAPAGEAPAAATVDTVEMSARVESIDYETRTVTLRGPEGNTRTFKVDPSVRRLRDIKAGDQIVVRVTQALAIRLAPS